MTAFGWMRSARASQRDGGRPAQCADDAASGAMLLEIRDRDGTDMASRVHIKLIGASFTVRLPITGSAK